MGYSHFLAVMNNVAMNLHVQVSVCTFPLLLFIYLTVELLGQNSVFNILRKCQTVLHSGCTILYSH